MIRRATVDTNLSKPHKKGVDVGFICYKNYNFNPQFEFMSVMLCDAMSQVQNTSIVKEERSDEFLSTTPKLKEESKLEVDFISFSDSPSRSSDKRNSELDRE